MASREGAGSRVTWVDEDKMNQIIDEAIPKSTKRQTKLE